MDKSKGTVFGRKKAVSIMVAASLTTKVKPADSDGFSKIGGKIGTRSTHSLGLKKLSKHKIALKKDGATVQITDDELTHTAIAHLTDKGFSVSIPGALPQNMIG